MQIILGTQEGIRIVRWLHGERQGRPAGEALPGESVRQLVSAGGDLLAVAPDAGLFRSADGSGWTRVAADLGGRRIQSVAAGGRDGALLYAGTDPAAVYVSRDGGATWTERAEFRVLGVREGWRGPGDGDAWVTAIAVDPRLPERLFVGVRLGGAFRSDDGGESWIAASHGVFEDVHALALDPLDGRRLYAATGGGLQISEDRGVRWTDAPGPPGNAWCSALDVVAERGFERAHLYLATAAGPPATWSRGRGAGAAMWASLDAGRTWQRLEVPAGAVGKDAFTAVADDPTGRESGFAGTSGGSLYHGSVEGGRWSKVMFGLPAIHAIAVR